MPTIRASGFQYSDPAEKLRRRAEFNTWRQEFFALREAEMQARVEDHLRDWEDEAIAKRWSKFEGPSRRADALANDKAYKKYGMLYDPTQARATMREMGLPATHSHGSRSTAPRSGGGGFFRANHWRPYDTPERRLNPLAGVGSGGQTRPTSTRSSGTFFSRYGDAKGGIGGSQGIMGASASRIRSSKEFLMNPETFMRRALIVWVADEANRAYTDYRGWDKVSYLDSPAQAAGKLNKEPINFGNPFMDRAANLGVALGGSVGGKVASMGLKLGHIALTSGLISGAAQGLWEEEDAALWHARSQATVDWVDGGFKGTNPVRAIEMAPKLYNMELMARMAAAEEKAKTRFGQSIDRTVDRMQDALALRGVGTLDDIKSAYRRSPDGQQALKRLRAIEVANKDDNQPAIQDIVNRLLKERKY